MKKLMVLLGAVALASGLSAATVDWKLKITSATTADAYNTAYHVYLVNAATWNALGTEGKTYEALLDNALDTATFNSPTGKSATNKTYDMSSRSIVDETLSKGDELNVYYMLVQDVGSEPKTYIAVSDTLTARAGTDTEQLGSNWSIAKSSLPASQDFYNVPEPTSGLLLLLGMAGLALRRRRA